jgi:phosphate transport system substrate-binding protein
VRLSVETVGKSIDGVKVKGQGNDLVLDTSTFYQPTETGAYPIVLATYSLVCSKYPEADVAPAVRAFLTVALGKGQEGLTDNGYIPVPDSFKDKLATAITAIS